MRTNRFAFWLGLLVVATLSVGALSFLLIRREGDKMRDNAEQSRLMAIESTSRAKLYHELAKQSKAMAEYAEQAAEDSLAIRARTVADNMDLTMADLKEGLMSGLRALPEKNRTEGLSSWTSSNLWVNQCFVWGAKEGLSFPAGRKSAGLSQLRDEKPGDWKREWLARNPTFWFQSDDQAGQAKDESNVSGGSEVADILPSSSQQTELSQNVSQRQTLDQEEALEVLQEQQKNSSALFSNILKNKKSTGKLAEFQKTQKAEEKNYGQAQSFLSQNLPVPQQNSTAWASGDNYSSSKLNRKQLRQETRNDAYFIPKTDAEGKNDEGLQTVAFTPREGWEYVRSEEGCTWFGWRQESPVRTHGVQLESKEVLRSLETAFPKNLVEGESFALKDDLGSVVNRAGQAPAKSDRFAKVSVPVGDELPGWNLESFRVLPTQVVLPPTELPDEGLLNKSFSLGSSIEGEWGGYLAFSSVIALILVAALLLGGSVLLIQVRRNSLEAVRKTTFVSNVSHELKTPLTTIRMYGEMLGDGIVKDETKKKGYLETIISESQRLTRLVNNVLDFGRLERGEKTYNREEIALGSAVGSILETQRPRLESAGLELEWSDDSQGVVANLDPDALEQVLLNLLDNLVKYAADGKYAGVRLAKDTELVILEVSDHGPGIPSEQREPIFETFHRVDDSLTSNKPGCGIGLGIARKLVEDMGGQITCEANEPKGAKFRIEFPQSS
ncbi:MAG: HAMP domain-containing histidine kinase [Opitutae bacterium]|nr:HAMP domain-containing histidine kinase [Opitutae bacterium]